MPCINVDIIRFVDEHQPGFVECTFTDAEGCWSGRKTLNGTLVQKINQFVAEAAASKKLELVLEAVVLQYPKVLAQQMGS